MHQTKLYFLHPLENVEKDDAPSSRPQSCLLTECVDEDTDVQDVTNEVETWMRPLAIKSSSVSGENHSIDDRVMVPMDTQFNLKSSDLKIESKSPHLKRSTNEERNENVTDCDVTNSTAVSYGGSFVGDNDSKEKELAKDLSEVTDHYWSLNDVTGTFFQKQ